MPPKIKEFSQSFFHGTKAELKQGDQIGAGKNSNYGEQSIAKYAYFTANLNVAVWASELALGDGRARIYVVEPTGPFDNDPNVTDKKFPGNPTNSFRTRDPLLVVGEVIDWQGHSDEEVSMRKAQLEQIMRNGGKIIED